MKRLITVLLMLCLLTAGAAYAAKHWDYTATCESGEKVCCRLNKSGGYDCTLYDAGGDQLFTFKSGTKHVVYTNGTILINDGDGGFYYVHDYNKKLLLKCREIETANGAPFAFESTDGLWGAIDEEGAICVPATYESLEALNAPAKTYAEEHGLRIFQSGTGRMGLMDADGTVLLPAQYECITPPVVWADGVVRVGLRQNGLWGWYGSNGQADCVFLHEPNEMFGSCIIAVQFKDNAEETQLCNADGTCAHRYDEAIKFSDTRLAVRNGKTRKMLDQDFNVLFETQYAMESMYGDRILVSDDNYMYGMLNANDGSTAVKVVYDEISAMNGGHALAQRGDTVSVIDGNGNELYTQAKADPDNVYQGDVLPNGYIVLKTPRNTAADDNETNAYNWTILTPELQTVCTFSGIWMGDCLNNALSYTDENAHEDVMIDITTGRELLRAPSIDLLGSTQHARVHYSEQYSTDDDWALYNTDGTRFLQGSYNDIGDTDACGLICVKQPDTKKYVFIDENENIVLQGDWDWAYGFDKNGYAVVNADTYIDLNGQTVAPCIYSDDVWF